MKKFPCIESTLDITDISSNRTIRLWINTNDIPNDFEQIKIIEDFVREQINKKSSSKELIERLTEIPTVNAIQVMEPSMYANDVIYGIVVYTVPFEDVHG